MILKGGKIILNNCLINKDLLIKNDIIEKVDDNIEIPGEEVIDVKDMLVMPGGIDVHVHFREPGYTYKETIKSGSEAAAKGGFTTVMTMPNLNPVPDSIENLKIEQDIIDKDAVVHIYPYIASTKGQKGLEKSDIISLKDKTYAISDDGMPVNNLKVLKEVMEDALKCDLIVCSHAETLTIDKNDPKSESEAVKAEIELAKEIGCRYHFCHLSTKESYDLIRKARSEGYKNISCEVSPHHLTLCKEYMMIKDANYKMNPPLRSKADMEATIEALADGTADVVATDHAPHAPYEKKRTYEMAPNGIIGIETAFPIIYTKFVKTNVISLDRFLDVMCYNAIKLFKLPERKLEVGYKADICVLDIEHEKEYKEDEIKSKSINSPFIGNKYYGFNALTIVDGKIVYRRG